MGIQKSRCVGCFSEHTNMESAFQLGELSIKLSHYYLVSRKCAQENSLTRKRLWRSGRVSERVNLRMQVRSQVVLLLSHLALSKKFDICKSLSKKFDIYSKIFFRDVGNFFRHLCELVLRHQMRVSNYLVNSFYSVVKALCGLISRPILDLGFFLKPMSPQDTGSQL